MKKLLLIILPIFSFAQQNDSVKLQTLGGSLSYQIRKSNALKNDSVLQNQFNIQNYQADAIKERRRKSFESYDENFRREEIRRKLLENNQSKGGKVID